MAENFLTISEQVLILFLMILCGYVCGKKGFINENGVKTCSNIVLYVATPSVIIASFIREFSYDLLGGLLLSILISALIHIGTILLVHLALRKDNDGALRVRRFAVVFSNAGYMALPLQAAVLGDMGVFFGASYVAMFNIFAWTYGVWCMSKEKGSFSAKKLFNPGVVSVVIGIIIFIFSIPVPKILSSTLSSLASLNTPVPMLIIGYFLSKCNLKALFKNKIIYPVIGLRLIAVPVIALILMYICGVRGTMLVSMMIAASAPTAALTTMFSVLYGADSTLSVNLVSITTLISIITMPTIVAIAQFLA